MAANKEQREIEIVMNGQKVNASLKEMGAAAALMNNQLRKMAADDPGRDKLKGDFNAMRDRISGMKQELYGVEKASLAAKLGFSDMNGFMKTVLGTAGGFLVGGGIDAVVSKVFGFFSSASEGARELEHALDNLESITGASAEDMRFYGEQADVTGIAVKRTADQVVEAYKLMGSAKPELLANRDALAATTEQALILANAAEMEVPDAVNSLAGSLNQFGEGADQAGRYINVLAAGAKEGASEISETAAALKNSGTVAAAANVSFEQTNALIQSLSAVSIKGAEAGTGLRNFLLTLQAGADDTNPAVVGLETALDNLGKKNLSVAELSKLFGKENVVVAQHLVKSREEVTRLTEAVTGTNEATKQAEINMNNMDGALAELDVVTKSYKDTLGKGLNVAITAGVKLFTSLLLGLKEAPKFVRENKDLFITLAVAIAALNIANIKAAASAIAQTAAEKGRAIATRSSAAAQWVLNAAMSANPIGVVIALIAGLVGGFVMLYNRSEKVRGAVNGIWESLKQLGSNIKEIATALLSGDVTAIMSAFKNIGSGVGDAYSKGYQEKLAQEKAKQKKKEEEEHAQAVAAATEKGGDLGQATADGFAASLKGKSIGQLEAMLEEETDAAHKKLIQKQLKHLKEVEKNEKEHLKEVEKNKKEHQEKVKKAREQYNDAVAKSELENAKLKIEIMEEGVDKVLAKLRFQHEQEVKEIEKHKADVLANVGATEEEKQALLDQYAEQQRLKDEELKLAEEEAMEEEKRKKQEEFLADLEEEELFKSEAIEQQFVNALDAEYQREEAHLNLKKTYQERRLALLVENGKGETLAAVQLKTQILKIDKEIADGKIENAERTAEKKRKLEQAIYSNAKMFLDFGIELLSQDEKSRKKNAELIKAFTAGKIMVNLAQEISGYMTHQGSIATFGVLGGIKAAIATARAYMSLKQVEAQQFAKGGMTKGGRTVPMAEVGGMWQMMSGHSGGMIGAFADGGWVNNAQLGLIGERGRELVIPNWMVESPKYANLVGYLEAERQKGVRAFADGGMTTGAQPFPNSITENEPALKVMNQMLQEMREMKEEVISWPNRLEVHNNVGETREKLRFLNDLEERASG